MPNEIKWVIPVEDESKPAPRATEISPDNELQAVLSRTAANEVTVKLSQVVELIGEEKANELALFATTMAEAAGGRVRSSRSMIPQNRRAKTNTMAMFFRKELLDAINEQHAPTPEKAPAGVTGEPKGFKKKEKDAS